MNATKPASILVIDDERNIRMMVRTALESEGYDVREASNGRDALETLRRDPPDLMVLDLNMPELDGVAVLEQMKSIFGGNGPRVVVLSAYGSIPVAVKAVQLGASDFIEKPVTPSELREIVRSVLDNPELDNVTAKPEMAESYERVIDKIRRSLKTSDVTTAESLLTKVADRRDQRSAEYFNLLGLLYESQGNWRLARKCYGKGMAADKNYVPAQANMRRVYELYTLGRSTQSVALGDEPEYAMQNRLQIAD